MTGSRHLCALACIVLCVACGRSGYEAISAVDENETSPAKPGRRLLFEDDFSGTALDATKWIPQVADQTGIWRGYVPAPYSAPDPGGYDAAYFDPAQVVVNDGLTISAERSTTFADYAWKSGCITTHGLFAFDGGYVEVTAKMPDSRTGMWGSVWLLEGGPTIDLAGSGYTSGAASTNATLESKLSSAKNATQVSDTGVDLSSDYHVYGLDYVPGQLLAVDFDGERLTTVTNDVPTGAYTIAVSLEVAQHASPWHTLVDATTPPSTLAVQSVRVYDGP